MAATAQSFDFDYALAPFGDAEAATTRAPRPGFWTKLYAALLDSRRVAAERELRRYAAMLQRLEGEAAKSDLPF